MQRSMHLMPRQGDNGPWKNTQNYALDKKLIRSGALEDGAMQFSNPISSVEALPRSQKAEEQTADAA
jgi:hypothetical protein